MKKFTAFAILLFTCLAGFAQPANDDCSGAIIVSTTPFGITCISPTSSSTVAATASTPGTACGGTSDDDDVWYSFTANSQSVVIRISNALMLPTGNANIGVEVLSGNCGTLTSIFCSGSTGSGSGFVIVPGLAVGQPYYLRFWTLASSGNANFNFCVQDVAAPPANDECSGAIAITTQSFGTTCTSSVSANTAGATKSTPDPSCEPFDTNDDIWYSFTAGSPSMIFRFSNAVFSTSSGNAILGMALYNSSCPASTTAFFCDNNLGSGNGHQVVNGLTVGATYYLRLWSFGTNNYCTFNFCMQDLPAPPANDDCSGAIAISTQPFGTTCNSSVSANTTGATQSAPNPSCEANDNNDDIWYSFTANSQSVIIRFTSGVLTTSSGNLNLALALYNNSCPATTTTFFCDNNIGSGNGHQVVNGLTIGTTYYLRLWSFGPNNYGSFDFCVQDVPPPPANDECVNAIPIAIQPFGTNCTASVSVNTSGATQSVPNASCGAGDNNDDVWYSFTASSSSVIVRFSNGALTTSGGNVNLAFALYNSSCPATTATFFCDDNIGSGSGYQIVNGLTIGNTYYLRLWSFAPNNYGSFDFCVQNVPPPPPNDECVNAIPVAVQPFGSSCTASVSANTSGATESAFSPTCGTGDTNDDIWYSFTANSQSVIVRFSNGLLTTSSGNLNLGFALYNGTCPSSTTSFICVANSGSGSGHQVINGLSIGNTYYLRMWSFISNNYGSFSFCVQSVPSPPPNDDCVNAINIIPGAPTASCLNPVIVSTAGATASANPPSCASATHLNDDVWYSFTATTAIHKLIVTNAANLVTGANAGIGYALYNGACPSSSVSLVCNSLAGSGSVAATFSGLVPGNLYYLRLWAFDINNYTSFRFCLLETPQNNECTGAVSVPVTNGFCTTPVAGTLATATVSAGFSPPSCNPSASAVDVWYKATVPATGNFIIQTSAVNTTVNNLVMEAYTGVCGTLSLLSCDDDGNPETSPSANHARIGITGRTPGEILYFRIMPLNAGKQAIL